MEYFFRIIGYGILLFIQTVLFYFLHSHFYFIVLVIMIAGPVLSIVSVFLLRRYVDVTVEQLLGKTQYGQQGDTVYYRVRISNPSIFVSLHCSINLRVSNTFFETTGEQCVVVPVRARKGYEFVLPVIATLPGNLSVMVESISIKDLMGFCLLHKKIEKEGSVSIMPQLLQEATYDKMALQQGMLESEESTKRGNDFSDVQEIREYIPGDKLMSIHWKLSAKRDMLMVKDRVSMSDRQLLVLFELCKMDLSMLNLIVGTTYSVVRQLLLDKTTVRLMYWSSKRYEYVDTRIDNQEQLVQACSQMYYETCYMQTDEAMSHMASVHPEIRSYLHIFADGTGVHMLVKDNQ